MLQVTALAKNFGAVVALKDASISVMPGEIRALLGANGSGKSTLVKILGGMVKPDHGSAKMDGKNFIIRSPEDAIQKRFGIAYQDLSLIPRMTIAENIYLGHEPKGTLGATDPRLMKECTEELIESLGIPANWNDMVLDLDASSKSLVEVAKALSHDPRILILDEVTASLHYNEVQGLFSLLKAKKQEGLGVIFVSHRLDEVFDLCDTATILRGGVSVADTPLKGVDHNYLVYHMTGYEVEDRHGEVELPYSGDQQDSLLEIKDLIIPPKINGVSLKVNRGEIVGIAGLVGQGQSEFLRAIYGALPMKQGSVIYKGEEVHINSPAEAVRHGIGFISGDREKEGIFSIRSVAENIHLVKFALKWLFSWVSPKVLSVKTKEIMQNLNIIAGSPEHPANSLSGGNQQKLIIGRWLMLDLAVLILDDPTKGVDVSSRHEIHDLLIKMTQEGTSVIISSSDNEELLEIANRIYIFYEGRIVDQLSGENMTAKRLSASTLGVKGSQKNGGLL